MQSLTSIVSITFDLSFDLSCVDCSGKTYQLVHRSSIDLSCVDLFWEDLPARGTPFLYRPVMCRPVLGRPTS